MFLVILTMVPLLGAFLVFVSEKRRINIPFFTSVLVLIAGFWGFRGVFQGRALEYRLPFSGPFVPSFRVDSLSAVMVLLASFLWTLVSVYAPGYMKLEGKVKQSECFTLLTFWAVLGVFSAGNMLTLLLFFEIMTLSSYFWVIHRKSEEAIRAGYFYLFFGIAGGLLAAFGIVLFIGATGVLPAFGHGTPAPLNPGMLKGSIALMTAGFGIKAGMIPFHVWLPHAHSAAPTPNSALLSGLLIKVGAYGLIRTAEFADSKMGTVLILLGIATMLLGVLTALLQGDAKRLLAYHSISQMGYIILGIGTALYLGPKGGVGLAASVYHIVNHALFKTALFLGVGIVYTHTKETNLYELGGLSRRLPLLAFLMLPPVLGIAGVPGFNGYASKTMIHHALYMAVEEGPWWMHWVERLFLLTGIGTAASFAKLYYLMFLGKPKKDKFAHERSFAIYVPMGILAAVIIGIGAAPELFPKIALAPVINMQGIREGASLLEEVSYWNGKDILSMFASLLLGISVCIIGLKSFFHMRIPKMLTIEGFVERACKTTFSLWLKGEARLKSFPRNLKEGIKEKRERGKFVSAPGESPKGSAAFAGISEDIALLILVLLLMIAGFTLFYNGLASRKLSAYLSQMIK